MIDEAKQDLATRYVLGELDDRQSASFRAELTRDSQLLQFVSELQETFAEVALAAAPQNPSPELLARILDEIREDATESEPVVEAAVVRTNWLPWALAACLTIACMLMGVELGKVRNENTALRNQDALSQTRIATLNAQTEAYEKVLAVVVWDEEKQRGVVKLDQLAQAAPDRDYQLWMIAPNHAVPISAGVVSVDDNGIAQASFKPVQNIQSVSKFAVSIERKGGAPAPEGPIILISK